MRYSFKSYQNPPKSGALVQFVDCSIVRNHQIILEDLWVQNGKIIDPRSVFFDWKRSADVVIDCEGSIVAPGFIETQINGGFGVDFSTVDANMSKNVDVVAKRLLQYGVTSFCPTVVSSSPDFYHKVEIEFIYSINAEFRVKAGSEAGAGILGLHLEGPFINKEKCGAHTVQHIVQDMTPSSILTDVYGCLDNVALITLAPELPGALEAIQEIVRRGIKVSVGHSAATASQGEIAIHNGASCITHLFNAMLPFHHRDPGLIGLLTSTNVPKNPFYGVIADGIHTHDAALRIAYRVDPDGLILVSDGVSAFGLGDGIHHLGDTTIEVKKHRAVILGKDTLVGSVSPLDNCVRHLRKAARCSVVESIECATLHPAQFLGITDRKGTLNYGSDADFILLDKQLNVKATYIGGNSVWCAK